MSSPNNRYKSRTEHVQNSNMDNLVRGCPQLLPKATQRSKKLAQDRIKHSVDRMYKDDDQL